MSVLAQGEPQPRTGTGAMPQLLAGEGLPVLQRAGICPFTVLYKFRLGIFVLTA